MYDGGGGEFALHLLCICFALLCFCIALHCFALLCKQALFLRVFAHEKLKKPWPHRKLVAIFPPPGGEWHAVAISWNHRLRCVLGGIPDALQQCLRVSGPLSRRDHLGAKCAHASTARVGECTHRSRPVARRSFALMKLD